MSNSLVPYNHIKHFYIAHHEEVMKGFWHSCDHVVCRDGFTMSVQAGMSAYSWPRLALHDGNYSMWEVKPYGFDDLLEPYSDGDICPYTPTEIVNAVIERHGGLSDISRMFGTIHKASRRRK